MCQWLASRSCRLITRETALGIHCIGSCVACLYIMGTVNVLILQGIEPRFRGRPAGRVVTTLTKLTRPLRLKQMQDN
jgi:hypothetical protein